MNTALVLGFYDRKNLGDDAYKLAMPRLFPNTTLDFLSMDDATSIPDSYDAVICGGGDIINSYFMNKAIRLLATYTKPIYAVSVGIPYESCSKYANIFDHVFLRSTGDCAYATKEIGALNVTKIRDAVFAIPVLWIKIPAPRIRIGICLAQPLFYGKEHLLNDIANALIAVSRTTNVEFHILAFNYSSNVRESDLIPNARLLTALTEAGCSAVSHTTIDTPTKMLQFMKQNIDVVFGSRYHSVVFSLICGIPFVAMYVSHKVKCILEDVNYDPALQIELPKDAIDMPTSINSTEITEKIIAAMNAEPLPPQKWVGDLTPIASLSLKKILIKNTLDCFEKVLDKCKSSITKYFNISATTYDEMLTARAPLTLYNRTPLNIARLISFVISGMVNHPCVWGLSENILLDDFCLADAIFYIWNECKVAYQQAPIAYYNTINKRQTLINVDFVFQNDFTAFHRAGWSYVIGGLMNLDAPTFLKTSDILVDTYLDRTFHWGFDTLMNMGILPYKRPWIGFIHHTFDESHSIYNCVELFKNPVFLESLTNCKALIVLSEYLAVQIRERTSTPVHVLYHPTEIVPNTFTMESYRTNPAKKVIQIGAWLRNPYAIYELPTKTLSKAALKGTEMDLYFAPPNFLTVLEDALFATEWFKYDIHENSMCRCICRDPQISSKFCEGYYNMTVRQIDSVEVIDKLSNDDYDTLLANNIVFLNLVDCSAVNTVIECIVRNTPIILNRHPALEEALGKDYPGFYNCLAEAGKLCDNEYVIEECYKHLKLLDKSRYILEKFVEDFQGIVNGTGAVNKYNLTTTYNAYPELTMVNTKFKLLNRFLPARYVRYNV